MTVTSLRILGIRGLGRDVARLGLPALLWNLLLAAAIAMAATKVLLGRTRLTQATMVWAIAYVLFFCLALAWLMAFSSRLAARQRYEPRALLRTLVTIEGPLLLLAASGSLAIYANDLVYHHSISFLYPAPATVLLLAVLGTLLAQEAALRRPAESRILGLRRALQSSRWALPFSLLLLGLLQGSSYVWAIGNDFTRYWAVADAMGSLAGYPASIHQSVYIDAGMYRYSIEPPLFPLLLLISFTALGHNTLGAHMPNLLANMALPLLLYAFYRQAGFQRPLAFATSCVVVLFPFFRLYTLNAPVPDAVFVALLVATAAVFLHVAESRRGDGETRGQGDAGTRGRGEGVPGTQHSALRAQHSALVAPLAFGLLAGLTALTRPEGLLFVGMMFIALVPYLFRPRFYLAAAAFLATAAPFSLLMVSTFGIPWPQNGGSAFRIEYATGNLDLLQRASLHFYAGAFGIPPFVFVALVGLVTAAAIAGSVRMARERWQAAMLPLATGLHVAIVFTIEPRVSGADQWFDFFRHVSYGIPFAALPLMYLLGVWITKRAKETRKTRKLFGVSFARFVIQTPVLALLLLAFSVYELRLLSFPAKTYGEVGTQLLTSDVWVSFSDIAARPHPLPMLPFVQQEGVLMIDPGFEYMPRHLLRMKQFFEPVSSLHTGKGLGYQVSSLLVLLFGFLAIYPWPRGEPVAAGPGKRGQYLRRASAAGFPADDGPGLDNPRQDRNLVGANPGVRSPDEADP